MIGGIKKLSTEGLAETVEENFQKINKKTKIRKYKMILKNKGLV